MIRENDLITPQDVVDAIEWIEQHGLTNDLFYPVHHFARESFSSHRNYLKKRIASALARGKEYQYDGRRPNNIITGCRIIEWRRLMEEDGLSIDAAQRRVCAILILADVERAVGHWASTNAQADRVPNARTAWNAGSRPRRESSGGSARAGNDDLAEFWSRSARRGLHPEDDERIPLGARIEWTVEQAVKARNDIEQKGSPMRKKVHARLFPHPFFGSLTDAAVYILTGNPGFDCNDYFDELGNPDYERACVRNLRGKADGFLPLSKEAEGTGAHRYWTRSLQPVIKTLAARLSAPSSVARQHICSKLAVLESLAYHSKERPGSYSDELPSSLCIRAFVETQLLPRARAGEIGIFVWRRRGFWGIDGEQPGVYLRSTGFINRNLFPEEVDFLASQIARVVES